MKNKEKIIDIIKDILLENKLIRAVFSNPIAKDEYKKITIKPVLIKEKLMFQFEYFTEKQSFHSNLNAKETELKFIQIINEYKQTLIVTEGKDIQILQKKDGFFIKEIINSKVLENNEHNKEKEYFLKDGEPLEFLISLGIMGKNGKVLKNGFNKFKQINKYIEFFNETITEMKKNQLIKDKITVVDFGCGKSYLTFALYHYLDKIKKIDFEIIGLDLKKDVIDNCRKLAKELNFDKIMFLAEDIKEFKENKEIDIVISLHACDTATDYSILKALELNSSAIMAVPCCHHELNEKIQKNKKSAFYENCNSIIKHGILLEKFVPIATDAMRASLLELCGYKTQVIEFIDIENTPKNILIRSIKTNKDTKIKEKREEYNKLKEFLGVTPILEDLIKKYSIN